ncbi:MAG TPA: hypothetical protein VLV81_13180 [Acidimicrobiia bacterium]|nr:hypothetical protein [Acidimicrobiia bacterium]
MIDRSGPTTTGDDTEAGAVVASLQSRAGDDLPETGLRPAVERNLARFQSARVRDFVPLLVERHVRSELLDLSRAAPSAGADSL